MGVLLYLMLTGEYPFGDEVSSKGETKGEERGTRREKRGERSEKREARREKRGERSGGLPVASLAWRPFFSFAYSCTYARTRHISCLPFLLLSCTLVAPPLYLRVFLAPSLICSFPIVATPPVQVKSLQVWRKPKWTSPRARAFPKMARA